MAWLGWVLTFLGFMGLTEVATMNARFILPAPTAYLLFREHLQPSRLGGFAATLSDLWLMAR